MNKLAVTQAQVKRIVAACEAVGKTVTGFKLRPDGSVDVLLTEVLTAPPPPPDDDGSWEAHEKRHGHG